MQVARGGHCNKAAHVLARRGDNTEPLGRPELRSHVVRLNFWASGSGKRYNAFVTEQCAHHDQTLAVAAGAVLQENDAQAFVMVCGATWAFASYKVLSGQRTSAAGTAFYNRWVSAMNSHPQTRDAVMWSPQPVIMALG